MVVAVVPADSRGLQVDVELTGLALGHWLCAGGLDEQQAEP